MEDQKCDAYVCESARIRISSSWFRDESSSPHFELTNLVQIVEDLNELHENTNHFITLRKNDNKRCEIVLAPLMQEHVLEWSSITIHSSSRIVEIYAEDRKNYISTVKHKSKVANNQYLCVYSSSQPVSCTSLHLRFLSLDHPSHKQSKNGIFNIIIVGTMKRQVKKQEQESSNMSASLANELMMNPSILMNMMNGLHLPLSPVKPIDQSPYSAGGPILHNNNNITPIKAFNDQALLNEFKQAINTISTSNAMEGTAPAPSVNIKDQIIEAIREYVQSEEMKQIVTSYVDERMQYYEKRILERIRSQQQ